MQRKASVVRLMPEDNPHTRPWLDQITLIEVSFPKYTDGRSYSKPSFCDRLGYGELRAVGHVLEIDSLYRSGIDAYQTTRADLSNVMEALQSILRFTNGRRCTTISVCPAPLKAHICLSDISLRLDEDVEKRLSRLNDELREASAQTILRASILREWHDSLTYVSSFGAESAVMLALIADVNPDLPIVFLETGMHFPQTLNYKETLIERLGLTNVRDITPDDAKRRIEDPKNTLWKTDPDACCALRKVRPLEPALSGFETWMTGRKRFHGGARMSLPVFEHAAGRFKVNPLAGWTQDDVRAYFKRRDLPRHP